MPAAIWIGLRLSTILPWPWIIVLLQLVLSQLEQRQQGTTSIVHLEVLQYLRVALDKFCLAIFLLGPDDASTHIILMLGLL
jgi:hypothetical protein